MSPAAIPISLSELSHPFLLAMVLSMYSYEGKLTHEPELLTNDEVNHFYSAYMGGPHG